MISDITIGQYFPGNSVVHKMDARVKCVLLLFLLISVFLCKNFFSLGLIVIFSIVLVAVSKISAKTILKSMKPLIFIMIFTIVLNLFYGTGEPLVKIGFLKITEQGIVSAVFLAVRIIVLVLVSSLLTYTTSPTMLTGAIESLLAPIKTFKPEAPHPVAMTMTIALRFIPTLMEEMEKITNAQKSRGADLDSGNLIQRIKALVPVLIPLFVSSFRRARELAYAMECRCYRGGIGRTKMNVPKMHSRDFVAIGVVVLIYAAIFLLNFRFGKIT